MNSSTFLTAVQNLGDRPDVGRNTGDAQMATAPVPAKPRQSRNLVIVGVFAFAIGIGIGFIIKPEASPKQQDFRPDIARNIEIISDPLPNQPQIAVPLHVLSAVVDNEPSIEVAAPRNEKLPRWTVRFIHGDHRIIYRAEQVVMDR